MKSSGLSRYFSIIAWGLGPIGARGEDLPDST